jgi:hypothetical protein
MVDMELLTALQMEAMKNMEKMQVQARNKQNTQNSDFSNKLQQLNKLAEAADLETFRKMKAVSRQLAKLQLMEERKAAMEQHHKFIKLTEKIETQRLRDSKDINFENARNGTKKAPIFHRVSGVEL